MNNTIGDTSSSMLTRITDALSNASDRNKTHIHARSDGSLKVGERPMVVRAFHKVRALFTRNNRLAQVNEKAIQEFRDSIADVHGEDIADKAIEYGRVKQGKKSKNTSMSVDFIKKTFAKVNGQLASQYRVGGERFNKIYNPDNHFGKTGAERQKIKSQLQANEVAINRALKRACHFVSEDDQRVLTRQDVDYAFSHLMKGMKFPVQTSSREGFAEKGIERDIQQLGANLRLRMDKKAP